MEANEISEVTRRAIIDFLTLSNVRWSGRLDEDDFLSRLYDLAKMRSTDSRYRTAAGDIHTHRVAFNDWPDDWVFTDGRFRLLHGPDDDFLRFLAETVHPAVRANLAEATGLVHDYNQHLQRDGYSLVEVKQISGKPVFGPQKGGVRAAAYEEPTGWDKVDRQMSEAKDGLRSATTEEQWQAVGLYCREVLISLALEVYDGSRHKTLDGTVPSKTDAARMLEAYIVRELAGGAEEETRAHGKAALKLALALQHKRTASHRMAALCLEATASVTNLIAIIAGRRE